MQMRFLREYAVDYNGRRAAIRAGYSATRAEVTASRLLTLLRDRPEMVAAREAVAATLGLDEEAVREGLLVEALGRGPDTSTGARLRAWNALLHHAAQGVGDGAGEGHPPTLTVEFVDPGPRGADPDPVPADAAATREAGASQPDDSISPRQRRFIDACREEPVPHRAALRAGYNGNDGWALARRFAGHPTVVAARQARNEDMRQLVGRCLAGLLVEARGAGPDTNANARVSAWKLIARQLGMISPDAGPAPSLRVLVVDPDGTVREMRPPRDQEPAAD